MEDSETMEIEADIVDDDQIGDLIDYQSDSELTLDQPNQPLISESTESEIRIVLQEGTQSGQIVKLDDEQIVDLYNSLGIPTDETS